MKSIEEFKFEYVDNLEDKGILTKMDIIEQNLNAIDAGIEFTQRWIPVEEELPTEQGHYLVKVKNSFPKNCNVIVCEFYEDNQKFYCEYSDSPVHDAISWRHIELK